MSSYCRDILKLLKWLIATTITALISTTITLFATNIYYKFFPTSKNSSIGHIERDTSKKIKDLNEIQNFLNESKRNLVIAVNRHENNSDIISTSTNIHTSKRGDNISPVVKINSPFDGALLEKERVCINGVIENSNDIQSITINSRQAIINGNLFSLDVPLDPGENNIQIVANDKFGNISKKSIKVTRQRWELISPEGWHRTIAWNKPKDILGRIYYLKINNELYIWTLKINKDNQFAELIVNSTYKGRHSKKEEFFKGQIKVGNFKEIPTPSGKYRIKLVKIDKAGKEKIFYPYAAWYSVWKAEF